MNTRKIKLILHDFYHEKCLYARKKYEDSKKEARKKYHGKENITILSSNCIAGEIYSILGLKFNSPTINTSINRKDFLIFLENIDSYLKEKLVFHGYKKNGTPIMVLKANDLPDIKISFPHDFEIEKIIEKWEERKKRIDFDNIYVLTDDRDLKEEDYERFSKLKYKKVLIFTSKETNNKNCFYVEKYKNKKRVGYYQKKGLDGLYKFQKFFDFATWLSEE